MRRVICSYTDLLMLDCQKILFMNFCYMHLLYGSTLEENKWPFNRMQQMYLIEHYFANLYSFALLV